MLTRLTNSINTALWGEIKIKFEGRVNLQADPKSFFNTFVPIFENAKKNNPKKVIIDLTRVDFLYPSSLLFLISLQYSLPNLDLKIQVVLNSQLHEYLCNCGLNKIYNIPDLPEGFRRSVAVGTVMPIGIRDKIQDEDASSRWFIACVDPQNKIESYIRNRTEESISEIFKNVKDHSGSSKCISMGQTFPISKNVRMCVYDNGVGIKSHLTKVQYKKKHAVYKKHVSEKYHQKIRKEPANTAIEAASIYGVSATKYEHNSGAGLNFIIEDFSKPYNGIISILSEDGYVQWESGNKAVSLALPYKIRGTMVLIAAKGLTE